MPSAPLDPPGTATNSGCGLLILIAIVIVIIGAIAGGGDSDSDGGGRGSSSQEDRCAANYDSRDLSFAENDRDTFMRICMGSFECENISDDAARLKCLLENN